MKTIISITWCWLFLVSSCSKSDSAVKPSLSGKWLLTQTLADPGDGSGKWTDADLSANSYLKFNTNGTLESQGFAQLKKYSVKDSVIEFINEDGSKINYRYQLENAVLEINPPCIEACGFRFRKAN